MRRPSFRIANPKRGGWLWTCVVSLALVSTAGAQTVQVPAVPDDADPRVQVAGLHVGVDPQTGKLRPLGAEEAKALSEALRKMFERPVGQPIVQHPNGMVSVELSEDFMEVLVAEVGPDGTVMLDCVTGMDVAQVRVASGFSIPLAPVVITRPTPFAARKPCADGPREE